MYTHIQRLLHTYSDRENFSLLLPLFWEAKHRPAGKQRIEGGKAVLGGRCKIPLKKSKLR